MEIANIKQNSSSKLGRNVFLALIIGIIFGQLVRTQINNQELLNQIYGYLNIVSSIFLRLIKMIIAPLVFTTLVAGIAKLTDVKSLGRMFFKSMVIFLIGGIIALSVGMIIVDYFEPGKALSQVLLSSHSNLVPQSSSVHLSSNLSLKKFIEDLVPVSVVEGFANNHIIQVVVFAIFFGIAGVSLGEKTVSVFDFFNKVSYLFFKITEYIMKLAPIAVFCAVSGIIINSGLTVIGSYLVYVLEFILCLIILWTIMIGLGYIFLGKQVFTLLKMLAGCLGISFSTSSSEAVFPIVLEKLKDFGVEPKTSGFVMPLGYSFNLIASMLNCSFATLFIIQLHGYTLTTTQKIIMLITLMFTSKGISGVPRVSLVIVAATLASLGIPEAAVLILFPIDGFLDMARSATNIFANALATTFVDKWEGNLKVNRNSDVAPINVSSDDINISTVK